MSYRRALWAALLVAGVGVAGAPAPAAGKRAKKAPAGETPAAAGEAPAAGGTAGGAIVLACGKDVSLRKDTAPEWRDCEPGQPVLPKDHVRSGRSGLASLAVGEARVWLDPSSLLTLLPGKPGKSGKPGQPGKPGQEDQAAPPPAIELTEGAARVAFQPAGEGQKPLRLLTREGEVRLRGVARVEIGPAAGQVQVAVYEGQAEIAGKRGTQRVSAGSGAIFYGGKRPAKPKVGLLIAAPVWEAEQGLFFALPQRGAGGTQSAAELVLPFRPAEGAQRYRLEIGRDEALTDRVYIGSITVGAVGTAGAAGAAGAAAPRVARARIEGKGRYFARLQAVDSDQVPGPGPVHALEVVEVRTDKLVEPSEAIRGRTPLLIGAGELAFELAGAAGKLTVHVDGRPLASDSPGVVPVKIGRGPHKVEVLTQAGHKGELRVEVTRPSYAIEITQEGQRKSGRVYRMEVRALDTMGQVAAGAGLKASSGELRDGTLLTPAAPVTLSPKGGGVFGGEVEVPYGRTVRLSLSDGDGTVASADLRGAQENP